MLYKIVDKETLNEPITKLLIDTDSIVYAIAFSMQEKNEEGEVVVKESIKDVFATVRWRCEDSIHRIVEALDVPNYELYIAGKGNFRLDVATIKPYKGQRPPKPILHADVRDYFVKRMNAQVVNSIEVDDKLAVEQTQYLKEGVVSVIASLDKDMLQVPGFHYKWETRRKDKVYPEELRFVTPDNGITNLYMQALTGDVADNIPGVKGIGPKKALALLKDCKHETSMYMTCWEQWFNYIKKKGIYKTKGRAGLEHESDDDIIAELAFDYLEEVLRLLYLLREDGDRWAAP